MKLNKINLILLIILIILLFSIPVIKKVAPRNMVERTQAPMQIDGREE